MARFYFGLVVLLMMGAYQSIITALGAHVVGYELPPVVVFALVSISPVLLLVANGLPALYSLLPNAAGNVPTPVVPAPGASNAAAALAVASEILIDRPAPAPTPPAAANAR